MELTYEKNQMFLPSQPINRQIDNSWEFMRILYSFLYSCWISDPLNDDRRRSWFAGHLCCRSRRFPPWDPRPGSWASRCCGSTTPPTIGRISHDLGLMYMIFYDYYDCFRADAHRRLRRITWPLMSSQGGLDYWMRTCCFRNIFLMLFGTYSRMCKNFCVKKLLRVKASLCKDFSV